MISAFLRGARCAGLGAIFLVAASAGRAAAPDHFPGLDAKWRHGRSENFEAFSRASEGETRELLHSLEVMRASFLQLLELPPVHPGEVTIYRFNSDGKFRAYASPAFENAEDLVGEYRTFHDREVIALSGSNGSKMAHWIVYSNYAKHMLAAAGGPGRSWLHQGISMFFGTFEPGSGRVAIGTADALRSRLARENPRIDVEQLFLVEEGRSNFRAQEQSNIFHAKAWALVHYWYCGQSDVPAAAVNRFVRFMLSPANYEDAERVRAEFEHCFGMNYAEMNKRVSRYMRSGRFPVRTLAAPKVAAASSYAMRLVEPLEMRERLGELRLRTQADPVGKFVLIEALNGPRAARAAEALGAAAALNDQDDRQAQEYWQRAVAAGTNNRAVLRLVTQLAMARWFSHYDLYFRLPEEKAKALRHVVQRWLELSPEQTEPYEALAWIESAAPEPSIESLNRVQAKFPELRAQSRTLLAIALTRARLGEMESALQLLDGLEQLSPTRAERQFAALVRQQFEGRRASSP